MKYKVKIFSLIGAGAAALLLCQGALAAKPKGPFVSADMAKPLKAAQQALNKSHNFDKAVQILEKAEKSKAKKNAYDEYLIQAMLGVAYEGQHNYAQAANALETAAASRYAPPAEKKEFMKAALSIYYSEGKLNDAIRAGKSALALGERTSAVYQTVAEAYYRQGKYREAADTLTPLVSGARPPEKLLQFQWDAYTRAKDSAAATRTVYRLVTYYPKPKYWLNALAPLLKLNITDATLQLDVYRLMNAVGVLNRPYDVATMANLTFDHGFPGETATVLKQAFANKVFTDKTNQERYSALLTGAEKKAMKDKQTLTMQEDQASAQSSGNALVAVGTDYLTYGEYEKAASAIRRGIQKGMLKSPEDANLMLGLAELKLHNAAEAMRAFEVVARSHNKAYAQLGRLWELHANSHHA